MNTNLLYRISFLVLICLFFFTSPLIRPVVLLSEHTYFHTYLLLELLTIIVSFMIALQGYINYMHTRSLRHLHIGVLFILIGLMDITHLFTLEGMPLMIGNHSIAMGKIFWLLNRCMQAIGLLYLFIKDEKPMVIRKPKLLSGFVIILYISLLAFGVWMANLHPSWIENGGQERSWVVIVETLVALFLFLTLLVMLYKYKQQKSKKIPDLLSAVSILLMSELFFTFASTLNDPYILFGHIYKAIGYVFLFKVMYFSEHEQLFLHQKNIEKQLVVERMNLQTISWNMGEGLLITDLNNRVTFLNSAAERILGWTAKELLHQSIYDVIKKYGNNKDAIFTTTGGTLKKQEFRYITKKGKKIILQCSIAPLFVDQEMIGSVALFHDVTKEKEQQKLIERQAYMDDLTQLPNQRTMNKHMFRLITKKQGFSLFLLNINRLKRVNDTLGPDVGDIIIRAAGERLRDAFKKDYVARIRGDEFSLLIEGVIDEKEVANICKRIQVMFQQPVRADQYEIVISLNIGVAIYPAHGDTVDEMIKKAYVALYSSKQQNHQFLIYNAHLDQRAVEALMTENQLYKALNNGEFELYYQPQIDSSTGKIVGLESLIRWNHRERGVLPPSEFISIAEITGLIIPIGEWIIRSACKDLKTLMENGYKDITMSVNLSIQQFYDENLIDKVEAILEETQIPPQQLMLELTESVMMNIDDSLTILRRLKELGVKISIDDFGTGYSSLIYLKSLPIDALKIDKTFIHDVNHSESDAAIVSMIIAIAKHLNLKIVAEGVENLEQLFHLKQLEEKIIVQGYISTPPIPLHKLLSNWEQYNLKIS